MVKNPPAKAGDPRDVDLTPGSGRLPGLGNGNLPQYSCLENSMDREVWQAAVHGITKSRTQLSTAHAQLIHVVVQWKITQDCKAIIF